MEEEGKMDDNNNNDNTIEEEEEEEGKVEENQIRRYDVTFTQGVHFQQHDVNMYIPKNLHLLYY